MQQYSRTKLTYGKDSLPALSGIAACVGHLNPGKYIAGLWEKDIGIQLGWSIDQDYDMTRRWEDPKDIKILGPTFSWSSHVIGPVVFPNDDNLRSRCTLDSFNIDLATSNPYGQVRHATLCLSGWSVPGYDMVTWLKTPQVVSGSSVYVYFDFGLLFTFDRTWKSLPNYTIIEELGNTICWDSVMCFGLYGCKRFSIYTDMIDAFLAQPSKTEVGKYVRIGVVQNLERSWFDETAVASTITLI